MISKTYNSKSKLINKIFQIKKALNRAFSTIDLEKKLILKSNCGTINITDGISYSLEIKAQCSQSMP